MKLDNIEKLERLSRAIGYHFKDESLLVMALTHRSCEGPHNERLEFLGDAILGLIIAEALYLRLPYAREGQMSRLRSNLVKGESLTKIARHFELGRYLRLGQGELKSGGQLRASILENALEALVGAIYLDVGFEGCRQVIHEWYQHQFDDILLTDSAKDAKSVLQEYVQGLNYNLPQYEILRIEGDEHNQEFFVKCSISDIDLSAEGQGTSRRKAEQEAAEKILEQLEL